MEKSEKAKQLRAMRKYGKKVRRSYKKGPVCDKNLEPKQAQKMGLLEAG